MPRSDETSGTVEIPADLTAAEARTIADDLRARLGAGPGILSVELAGDGNGDGNGPSISAMQLLISLCNTQAGATIRLGETAMAALAAFAAPATQGGPA